MWLIDGGKNKQTRFLQLKPRIFPSKLRSREECLENGIHTVDFKRILWAKEDDDPTAEIK